MRKATAVTDSICHRLFNCEAMAGDSPGRVSSTARGYQRKETRMSHEVATGTTVGKSLGIGKAAGLFCR